MTNIRLRYLLCFAYFEACFVPPPFIMCCLVPTPSGSITVRCGGDFKISVFAPHHGHRMHMATPEVWAC